MCVRVCVASRGCRAEDCWYVCLCVMCVCARVVSRMCVRGKGDRIGLDWIGLIADHFLANFARVGSRRVECCSVFWFDLMTDGMIVL